MAEKTKHAWFNLDLSNASLGSSPMSLTKGGMKDAKYNLIISKDLADYE